jgi:hypothetical protein
MVAVTKEVFSIRGGFGRKNAIQPTMAGRIA